MTRVVLGLMGVAMLGAAGCETLGTHRHELDQFGQVFYFDGAGGGAIGGWSGGVKNGLRMAGYEGDFVVAPWHTGLGVGPDQTSSVEYKRGKAREMADRIEAYMREHPNRPVHVIGLSAGTAVAVFALEALPENRRVDDVVLLGSSLSSHYNLSNALRCVRGDVYVYTSERDGVLGFLVPAAGTADRQFCGACAAGLHGFHLPADADGETRVLYEKVENIMWRSDFAAAGNYGGHTDAVNSRFVRDFVAPHLMVNGPRFTEAGLQPVREENGNE